MIFFLLEVTKIIFFIPASKHSSKICSKIVLFPSGNSSFGSILLNGRSLVPKPANGIIASFIIKYYI